MIQEEYLRFLRTLGEDLPDSEGVCKIANLVQENMAELVPLSTHQGQRVRRMVELAQANWATVSSTVGSYPEGPVTETPSFLQLNRMSVGPFRGFARQEEFDLSSRLVLIYGPNGTGKSSFCEALELGLLGNVAEAENKRFRNQGEYFKNANVDQFVPPEVYGLSEQGEEIPIEIDEARNRFCFVEKNRIDSFSRIAALAPAKQTELISTLFGLDAFNDFVRNFSARIDNYIDLDGAKFEELKTKRTGLAGATQQIETQAKLLQDLEADEVSLAQEYREDCSFKQMAIELEGTEESPGSIQLLETELQQPLASKSDLTVEELQSVIQSIQTNLSELTVKRDKLANASQEVSFQHLYDAVAQVEPSSPEHCPACKTPLLKTSVNPYTHAGEELGKLRHLSVLQGEANDLETEFNQSLSELSQVINACLSHLPDNNVLHSFQVMRGRQADLVWWNTLSQPLEDELTPLQQLESQVNQLESADKAVSQAEQLRCEKKEELQRLQGFAKQITVLQTRRDTAQDAHQTARQLISDFDDENAQLIAEVEAEKSTIAVNQAIVDAYAEFVERLNAYKDQLPGQLVANLGDVIVELYNAFNRNDSPSELLAAVRLPLASNQRLEICFQTDEEQFFDALHVLSEGHIRCIGLAILLAKNLKENCPVLIFDDPVNAIDHDHKESIRKTLFEDSFFSEKQIVLTSHGEEFFKDIQNLLPVQVAKQAKSFTFLPRLDDVHIRVDFDCEPRNYIIGARGHLDRLQVRDALTKSRQALEALAKGRLWRYVHRFGDGNLSIRLRSATAPLELRNLTEQLSSKVAKGNFSDPEKDSILVPLQSLLLTGNNGDSREWRYLNKGTHEETDRDDFDRQVVSEIVEALEILDRLV